MEKGLRGLRVDVGQPVLVLAVEDPHTRPVTAAAAAAASASLSAIVRDYHGDGVPGPCHRLTPCLPCPALCAACPK